MEKRIDRMAHLKGKSGWYSTKNWCSFVTLRIIPADRPTRVVNSGMAASMESICGECEHRFLHKVVPTECHEQELTFGVHERELKKGEDNAITEP